MKKRCDDYDSVFRVRGEVCIFKITFQREETMENEA